MNAETAEILYRAEREGIKQLYYRFGTNGEHCAAGAIYTLGNWCLWENLTKNKMTSCPLCGATSYKSLVINRAGEVPPGNPPAGGSFK